ncbi:MAG: ATPase, partial [Planctomycetes bacterium]|nr:ATPase [Planctomycetota bacterium]
MICLGLDVGGTSCRAEWWPAGARPCGVAPGVQPAVQGVDAAVAGLLRVLRELVGAEAPAAAVVAMAGAGDPRIANEIRAGLGAAGIGFPVAVVGDVLAAAAAALGEAPGVLLWSGTGSFAVARGADGVLHRVGGRGYLLGDQGSGYDLVRRAAAAVVLALDGLGPATALTGALTGAFGAASPARLGAVLQQLPTGAVAAELPVVLRVAAAGDAVAGEVLAQGAEALALLAAAAARSAGLEPRGLASHLGGGVLLHVPAIAELV